jgi:hypothetical protein
LIRQLGQLKVQAYIKVLFLFLLLLALVIFGFVSWLRSKGESAQASIAIGLAKVPVF